MKLIFDTLAYHECIKIQYNFRPTFSGFAYYSILSRDLSRDFLFVKKTFDNQDQQVKNIRCLPRRHVFKARFITNILAGRWVRGWTHRGGGGGGGKFPGFGKLPAIRGASNLELSEPTSMFWFLSHAISVKRTEDFTSAGGQKDSPASSLVASVSNRRNVKVLMSQKKNFDIW
jgi:hypothetical protein